MQEFMDKALPILNSVLQILGGLVVAATVVAKMTKTEADDKYISGFAEKFYRVIAWLPTIGINPQTKKLQEAYEELKSKDDAK